MAIEAEVTEEQPVEVVEKPQEEPKGVDLFEADDAPKEVEEKPQETNDEQPSVEEIAKDLGWRPKGEFQGDDDNYVDPVTYIKRSKDIQQSMSQHLKDNRRKLEQMEKAVTDLHHHYKTVSKAQITKQQKEIDRLRKEKREAIEEGDADRVDQIESEMLEQYSTMEANKPTPEIPEPDPTHVDAFTSWHSQNDWYGDQGGDPEMTAYADKMADLPQYEALPYQRKLAAVTELVKNAFPEKFTKTPTPTTNPVEAPRSAGTKRQYTMKDLNDVQRAMVRNFVNRGIMTEKKYIQQLADAGEIG